MDTFSKEGKHEIDVEFVAQIFKTYGDCINLLAKELDKLDKENKSTKEELRKVKDSIPKH